MTPERFRRLRETLDRRQPDLTVVMENVHKAHNFSAVLRSCDAVGVLEAHAVTPGGPVKGHRATSSGSNRWVRSHTYSSTAEAVAAVKGQGLRILAADLREGAVSYREADFTRPTAILLGQEKLGLSDEGAEAADGFVIVPMVGLVASLNVSVAAALLLFEARHQRAEAGLYDRRRLDDETYRTTLFEWAYPELAEYCRREGFEYPRLGEDGEIVDPIPE